MGPIGRTLEEVTGRAVTWMAKCFVGAPNVHRLGEAFPQSHQLADFPPTVIVTGDRDRLRPSGEAFAEDLRRSGVPVEIRSEPGTRHGHLNRPDRPAFDRTISTFTDWMQVDSR